jgi:hypothetical protein
MPSGKHHVNQEKLQEWINSQASPRRREAASALAKQIRYFTLADTIALSAKVITEMYNDPEKPISPTNKLKWYTGPTDKSGYLISILCYHLAKLSGYRLPDEILTTLTANDMDESTTIFYLDDMSYSSSQLKNILTKIRSKNPNLDMRIGLTVATSLAERLLQTLNKTIVSYQKVPNPFKRYIGEIIPDIEEILGEKLYTDCIVYFSSFRSPPCICYFDHKTADSASTFLYVLSFGPVPPSQLDFKRIYSGWGIPNKKTNPYLNHKDDVCDKEIHNTEFIPFITGCSEVLPEFKKIPYEVFMMDIDEYTDSLINIPATTNSMFLSKNSPVRRCPKPWYKSYFKGGSRKLRKRSLKINKTKKYH